jgi:soluble lytic murein transglycosylase-like protein
MRFVVKLVVVVLVVVYGFLLTTLMHSCQAQVPQQAQRYRAELVRAAQTQWGLDAPIAALAAQVHQESGWNPLAVSRVGATGMAQFMPATATWWCTSQRLSVAQCTPTNPTWALRALVGYDKWLFDRVSAVNKFNQLAFALCAYNGGLGWVNRDKLLASGKGLDKLVWFGSVETVNAGRTLANWQENRAYPQRILHQLQPRYASWGTVL